jgi:two-component system, NarL family, nitrate/nitrite response regulator NarL
MNGLGLAILLLEPNEVVRRGVQEMLALVPPIGDKRVETVVATSSLEDALSSLARRRFDVVLFPCDIGQTAGGRLIEAASPTPTLVMLRNTDPAQLTAAAQLSVTGFLLEPEITVGTLERALVQLLAGEVPIPGVLVRWMLGDSLAREAAARTARPVLSPREAEVLDLLVDGLSNKQIARALRISEHGAKRHVANVLMKLNCPNRTLAVARALQDHLVPARSAAISV